MDRIEQLMRGATPHVAAPSTASADAARSIAFSDDPNVLPLAGPARSPGRTAVRVAAGALAAAAVVAGIVVAGSMRGPEPAPAPAGTSGATPAPSISTTPPAPTAGPTPAESPRPTAPAALSTGGVPCAVPYIDQILQTQAPAIAPVPPAEQQYYSVLGCADGWLAYSISDDGVRALGLDGGNAWYRIARLQHGRFVFDPQAPWATVFSWKFHALNNDVSQNGVRVTAQEAMDQEFAQKGIPVELRRRLVGEGPVDAG